MHFNRDIGLLQGNVIGQRLLDAVHLIVLRLQQKGRGRVSGHMNVRTQAQIGFMARGIVLILMHPQMARIDRHGEIRAAAQTIRIVDGLVRPFVEMRADSGNQMPAGRKADHPHLVRVKTVLPGMLTQQAERALGVLKRRLHFRIEAMPVFHRRTGIRHAILQKHTHAPRRDPVANLRPSRSIARI
jgi:hypothetical protein